MKIICFYILILFLSFPAFAQNSKYPESSTVSYSTVKDYYRKSYGYNTKEPCVGPMCLPADTIVGCSSYDYSRGGVRGIQLQVCNMSSIKNPGTNAATDVSRDKLKLVTGIIDKGGKYSTTLPQGEVFIASRWRVQRYEPTTQQQNTTEADVCFPGLPCSKEQHCNSTDPFSLKLCLPKSDSFNFVTGTNASNERVDFDTKAIARAFDQQRFANLCHSFIQPDGSLGSWGKEMISSFNEVCKECFFGENNINVSALCPNYEKFSQPQKEYFVAWLGASVGHSESGCRQNVRVKGTKVNHHQEYAVGLVQMEESMHRRKNRGPECLLKKGQSVYSISFQFKCMASIIRDTRWAQGKPLSGNSSRQDQYWDQLKTKNGKISKAISNFPGCK